MTPLTPQYIESCPVDNGFRQRGMEMTRIEVFVDDVPGTVVNHGLELVFGQFEVFRADMGEALGVGVEGSEDFVCLPALLMACRIE